MAATGSDCSLLKLAEKTLKECAWPVEVLTGRNTFLVGENERYAVDTADRKQESDGVLEGNEGTKL